MAISQSSIKIMSVATLVMVLAACATSSVTPVASKSTIAAPATSKMPSMPEAEALPASQLEDRIWQLVTLTQSMGTNNIQDGAFLSFQSSDHRVKGSTGCNRLMGSYQLTGSELSLAEIASTKIFCPNGGIVQEAMFIEALTDTTGWKIDANHLYLLNAQNETLAVFELR